MRDIDQSRLQHKKEKRADKHSNGFHGKQEAKQELKRILKESTNNLSSFEFLFIRLCDDPE